MDKPSIVTVLTDAEFNKVCSERLEDVRRELLTVVFRLDSSNDDYKELSEKLDEISIDLARVKINLQDTARSKGVAQ